MNINSKLSFTGVFTGKDYGDKIYRHTSEMAKNFCKQNSINEDSIQTGWSSTPSEFSGINDKGFTVDSTNLPKTLEKKFDSSLKEYFKENEFEYKKT